MTIVPIIKRDYTTNLGTQGKRIDGRNFDHYRKIEIETNVVNKAEGSARVKIGNTQVLCGIKMDIGEPFPDTPETGVMSTVDGERSAFMYLDPPYDIKDNLYGNKGSMHQGFDHDKFAADCDNNDMDQLKSYNSDQLVTDRFKNWNAAEFDLTHTMRSVGEYMRDQKERKELLLFNYGIEGLVKLDQSN